MWNHCTGESGKYERQRADEIWRKTMSAWTCGFMKRMSARIPNEGPIAVY